MRNFCLAENLAALFAQDVYHTRSLHDHFLASEISHLVSRDSRLFLVKKSWVAGKNSSVLMLRLS